MTYQENDRIHYLFKGDEDNEPCNDVMVAKMIKNVEQGEFIKLAPSVHNKAVFKRGEFDRTQGKYIAEGFTTGNERAVKGETIVFINFIF